MRRNAAHDRSAEALATGSHSNAVYDSSLELSDVL
jgi:hypothetical protein